MTRHQGRFLAAGLLLLLLGGGGLWAASRIDLTWAVVDEPLRFAEGAMVRTAFRLDSATPLQVRIVTPTSYRPVFESAFDPKDVALEFRVASGETEIAGGESPPYFAHTWTADWHARVLCAFRGEADTEYQVSVVVSRATPAAAAADPRLVIGIDHTQFHWVKKVGVVGWLSLIAGVGCAIRAIRGAPAGKSH